MRGHSWQWGRMIRRAVLRVVALGATTALPSMAPTQPSSVHKLTVLRIGYQRFGDLNVLKARGTLEKSLAPLGITVRWTLFPAGPQLLEGLNVGSIDLGTTGEAPPIFAQAAGAPLVYVATEP